MTGMLVRRKNPVLRLMYSQRQQGKKDHSQVTCEQILKTNSAAGKKLLGQFLDADQESQHKAAYNSHSSRALEWKRTKESQVDQQGQDPVEDEMPHFISIWNLINRLENSQLSIICKNDD